MPGFIAECTRPHLIGTRRIGVGTRAVIVGATVVPTASLRLQITEPGASTELRAGESFTVPTAIMSGCWRTLVAPAGPSERPDVSRGAPNDEPEVAGTIKNVKTTT
jgi:hypothetical protein